MSSVDLASLSGLDLMRWLQAKGFDDIPSVGRLLGMNYDEVEKGRIAISIETQPEFANPMGIVHGGIISTLLDSVMGCAVHTCLPVGTSYATLELKVNFIRATLVTGRKLTGEGTVIHLGRRTATAEGKVHDEEGKLVAHATTTCIILDGSS
ncbi:PaaI family thioesterase [Streptomyces sp. NPDC026665]|uniref:PaaI family thioesterase n=1 Tax=Streptomyces sp. NPDC026665 TaxID=3154798 RepID=UPI0033FB5115